MAELALLNAPTRGGAVALYGVAESFRSPRTAVVFIHGAGRSSVRLTAWVDLLQDQADVVLLDLPGHGRSLPVVPASVANLADNVADALAVALPARRLVLVGESLGGLIAMDLAARRGLDVRALVAADPPFRTAKQWQLHRFYAQYLAEAPDDDFLHSLAFEMFGASPGREPVDRVRYGLLDGLEIPVDVVTGDFAAPPGVARGLRCMLDEADKALLRQSYAGRVRLHALEESGHLVLEDRRDFCLDLIRRRLAEAACGGG